MERKVSKRIPVGFFTFILALSTFNLLVYLSMRPFWYFINRDTKTPLYPKLHFSTLLLFFYSLFLIYTLILFIMYLNKQKTFIKVPAKINVILPIFLGILFSCFSYYLFTRMEGDQYLVTGYLKSPAPYLFIFLLIILLVFFNPNHKFSQIPLFYYAVIIAAIVIGVLYAADFGEVKITTGPSIMLQDKTHIAVLWTTDKNSTTFVEYGPDKYHLQRAFMSKDGLVNADTKVHKVIIPIPENSDVVYRVSSTKINHYYQNNVDYGNTVMSEFKRYSNVALRDKLVFYTLNDVHENMDIYKKFLSKNDYDFVVMNGDTVNSLDKISDIVGKILKPLSNTESESKPFFLVRGNHETRGGASRLLQDYLALPNGHYYYTIRLGPVFGIVLDSGEDKLDNDVEYSGLADFKNYKAEETKWLKEIYESSLYKDAKYKIAFVHIPLNTDENNTSSSYLAGYEKEWRDLLNKMKIDVVFSGHTHAAAVIKPDGKNFTFPTIIGGGPTDDEKKYEAVRAEVDGKGMKISYVDYNGTVKEIYTILPH